MLDDTIRPQADEVGVETMEKTQTVTFMDADAGDQVGEESPTTVLMEAPMMEDSSLSNFMSRPVKILDVRWPSSLDLFSGFNPWQEFFGNKRVINRISNYKLLQCNLHVKVLLNGTPFHYGGAMMNYIPLAVTDTMSTFDADDSYRVLTSQRPMIYLNPTTSQGGEMTLPFFYYKNAMDITKGDWKDMGYCFIESFTPLKHSSGANADIDIAVYVWATNVKLGVPTHINAEDIIPQSDEYSTGAGPISKPAGIVANMAARLTTAPWIGPYARATEIGAKAVAAIASVFGYSRPVLLDSSQYRPITKGSIAVTNMPDDTAKLSVDAKQELTIDSRTVGLSGQDELDILSIATRPSYYGQFQWPAITNEEVLLWNSIVTPLLYRDNADKSVSYTAMGFASLPFKKWRGSIKFHFKVLASKFHKGRLSITYDPTATRPYGDLLGEYNTAYTMIVDLAEKTEFDFTVGWGQATTYRDMGDPLNTDDNLFDTSPLFYDSRIDDYANGTVSVRVANKLVSPDTTINNDVTILVWVSAGDDFELAMPTGDVINRLRASDQANPLRSTPLITSSLTDNRTPPTKRSTILYTPTAVATTNPAGADTVVPQSADLTVGATTSLVDATNHVHFGECNRSFRQLLKRYTKHENIRIESAAEITGRRIQRPAMPFFPGAYTPFTPSLNDAFALDGISKYVYGHTSLIRYLSSAFVGWRGGVRVLIDMSGNGCCKSDTSVLAARSGGCIPEDQYDTLGGDPRQRNIFSDDSTGTEGAVIQDLSVNGVVSFEVPYYSEYRFTPCRQNPGFGGAGPFNMPCYKVYTTMRKTPAIEYFNAVTMYAAAEDFTLFHYLGPPKFWYETVPPLRP